MKKDICTYKGICSPLKVLDERPTFLQDYGSIIYRSQFRRLSNKTQVFLNPSIDFPRTRLTHSIEVEQVSKEITRYFITLVNRKFELNEDKLDFSKDFEDLVCAACLAHDLGQAPFGHKGEATLYNLMNENDNIQKQDCFEANKQNIRILVGSDGRRPYGVSCALIDSIMKYKSGFFEDKKKKYPGCYTHEKKIIECLNIESTLNIRHPVCYIMEAADDISYISSDLQDAIKLKLVSLESIRNLLAKIPFPENNHNLHLRSWDDVIDYCDDKKDFTKITSFLIKSMLKILKNNLDNLFDNITTNENLDNLPERMHTFLVEANCDLNFLYYGNGQNFKQLKEDVYDFILKDKEIGRNEFLAEKVIKELWSLLCLELIENDYKKSDVFKFIPEHVQHNITRAHENKKTL